MRNKQTIEQPNINNTKLSQKTNILNINGNATSMIVITKNTIMPQSTFALQPTALQFNNDFLRSTRKTVKRLAISVAIFVPL